MLIKQIRKEIVLFLFLCVGLLSVLSLSDVTYAAGATYYVDASAGNNSNDGTSSATAWQTITKVNGVSLQPGDQVLFKRGEIWQGSTLRPSSSGVDENPIRYGSYGDPTLGKPIISGGTRIDTWIGPDVNGEYKKTGLTGDGLRFTVLEDGKRLKGNHADARLPGPTIGSLTPGSFVADSVTGSVYYKPSTGVANDHVIEIASKNSNFAFSSNGKNYLLLDGIDFRGGYDFAVFIGTGSHHVTVQNSAIHGADRAGVRISGASYNQLLNNQIYDMNYFGIALEGGASNNVISGNHVHDIGLLDTDDGDTVGIQIVGGAAGLNSKQNTIEKNEIEGIGRDIYKGKGGTTARGNLYHAGILVDSSTDTSIVQNHIHDLYRSGILIFTATGDATNTAIRNNVIDHVGKVTSVDFFNSAIYLNTRSGYIDGTTVYNNTIANSRFKADTVNREAAVFIRVQGQSVAGAKGTMKDVSIMNNLIAGNEGNYMLSFHADNEATISGLTIDHNLYTRPNSSDGGVYWNQGGVEKIYKANQMFGASSYSVEKNQDHHAIVGDPLFMDASQANYALQTSSPAIDAGASVGLAVDFLGNPRPVGDGPDIGAYEEQHPFIAPPVITGVVNGQVYTSVVSATYDRGVAWLTRNSEAPVSYLSGTSITQAGNYVLSVTYMSQTTTVSFTIDTSAPVITGVIEGERYTGSVTPEFNKGRGMLYRMSKIEGERQVEARTYEIVSQVEAPDGIIDKEISEWVKDYFLSSVTMETEILVNANFLSGTVIHEPGSYRLTVTDAVYNVAQVSFQIQDHPVTEPEPEPETNPSVVVTGPTNVHSGAEMVVTVGLKNAANASAMQFTVVYDPERFTYVSSQSMRSGIGIVQEQHDAVQGKIHFILASLGSSNVITGAASIVEMNFVAKETVTSQASSLVVRQVKIANGQGVETNVADGSYTIQILGNVNKELLIAKIAEGEALLQGAVEGNAIGNYFPGSIALRGPALAAAILAAKSVVQSDTVTQAEVDAARQAVETAISHFELGRILTETGNLNNQPGITVGDLGIVAYYYGSTSSSPNWSEAQIADIDDDGVVGLSDMTFIVSRMNNE
ncbi:right-handed parallel beta-helix repeat-containing protein [Paenibacillus qinlingensis]|uniref:right-handed parallel beta-helix repeat-containing protein n=1 Tax=Paenibacillus qinlingensis TaxID=1837343 RepID=UPI001563F852|nr:right-handed parallel beta-helix repeat-containing protein [Paenibacillus qinlingensis]NQX59654.1 right-handed parallel beta-helix repeat-containing protein [Paenibacillus qinlingensis]